MSTAVKMKTTRPASDGGKTVTKKISNVNPNATNEHVSQFVGALNTLSKNTLPDDGIQKITKNNLQIPQI